MTLNDSSDHVSKSFFVVRQRIDIKRRQPNAIQDGASGPRCSSVELVAWNGNETSSIQSSKETYLLSQFEPGGVSAIGQVKDAIGIAVDGFHGSLGEVIYEGWPAPLIVDDRCFTSPDGSNDLGDE